jgi:parvulin-like peptidyl-prolyl isomerase
MKIGYRRAQVLVFFCVCVCLAGCGGRTEARKGKDSRKVALINNYTLTVEDFKREVSPLLDGKTLSDDSQKAKEEMLEELITKEVLLQEAQKLNLDKEDVFMREIENYWKQTLLKLLINKRSKEVFVNTYVEDRQVLDEYQRMKRKIYAQVVIVQDKEVAATLSEAADAFDTKVEDFKEKILAGKTPEWWMSGDLPQEVETLLFGLKAGDISKPVAYGNNWVIIKMIKEEENVVAPIEEVESTIRNNILQTKIAESVDAWIKELRQKASVKVNKDVLKEIQCK